MEFLMELIFDLIVEGSIELSSNKKVPKIIRYPLIVLVILFFGTITFGCIITGAIVLKENIAIGVLLIFAGAILLIGSIKEFKKRYINKKENNN